MSIEAIVATGVGASTMTSAPAMQASSVDGAFAAVLDELQAINHQMHANQESVRSLAVGGTENLHQVMMDMERTRLAFDLVLQVRNKTLEAYQELMRMQV